MTASRQPLMPEGKTFAQVLQERRAQALEPDSAMVKEAPQEQANVPSAIKTHPLESAFENMTNVQLELEQIVEIARRKYESIEKLKATGDAKAFLDPRMWDNPERWAKAEKELASIKNKLLTALPTQA